jgi:glyoxylase-like metal-dependent hydrolase (beta-lactamase superfamily II)
LKPDPGGAPDGDRDSRPVRVSARGTSVRPVARSQRLSLQRPHGNLLVYSAPTVEAEAPAIAELGGVSRQYLNHWHETLLGCVSGVVGAPLLVNEHDRESAKCEVDETFSERALLADDFELIPIPGHTSGATAFLWNSGEQRVLFTGDSIYLRDGEWVAAVLGSSDRERYGESLELLRELDFDLLVPWAATGGQQFYAATDKADARRRIDTILERVRRGEDH